MSSFIVHSVPGSPFDRAVLITLEEKGASWRAGPAGTLGHEGKAAPRAPPLRPRAGPRARHVCALRNPGNPALSRPRTADAGADPGRRLRGRPHGPGHEHLRLVPV